MICLHSLKAWGKGWTQSPTVTFLFFLLSHNVSLLSEIFTNLLKTCLDFHCHHWVAYSSNLGEYFCSFSLKNLVVGITYLSKKHTHHGVN